MLMRDAGYGRYAECQDRAVTGQERASADAARHDEKVSN
jgi:hypothetical protein